MERILVNCAALTGVAATLLVISRSNADQERAVKFSDVTAAARITFRHDNARSNEKYLIETMGAGAAWIDFDNDGRLDLYLVNSAPTKVYQPQRPLSGALYRNNGDGTFTDVTARVGVAATGIFGMGVAVGDYDNDGFSDLYVIGYGQSILYHN